MQCSHTLSSTAFGLVDYILLESLHSLGVEDTALSLSSRFLTFLDYIVCALLMSHKKETTVLWFSAKPLASVKNLAQAPKFIALASTSLLSSVLVAPAI